MSLDVCPILPVSTLRVITPAPVIMDLLEMVSKAVKVSCYFATELDDSLYTL